MLSRVESCAFVNGCINPVFINSFKHLQTSFVSLASLSNSNFSLLDRPVALRVMGVIDLVSPKLAFMGMMLVKLILTDSQANTEATCNKVQ